MPDPRARDAAEPFAPHEPDPLPAGVADTVAGLDGLNSEQRAAAEHVSGPALVLAGAGSGKTRVITHRLANLVTRCGVPPWRIVAVTFTNKAAGEMRERVARLLGAELDGGWVGTFHALCLRMLRRDGEHVGLRSGFNVYDTTDQLAVVRGLLKETSDDPAIKARAILSRISRAKNALESPEDVERRSFGPEWQLTARVYRGYLDALDRANAVDFDDILLRALRLVQIDEHRERYAERCEHLLVDEYQDTNRPQYLLVRALASVHGNLFVVGDEDQSIYRFRGADIRNILDFERDHPGACVYRLEQNYRSTGTILEVAGSVIENNVDRKGKRLWTENPDGERVELYRAPDDRTEAAWVATRIRDRTTRGDVDHGDIAVLYRTNAQSRQLEEIFRRERIPYRIIGSVQFYERKEVKDLLGYLKLLANPADDVSFRRVVNTPPRGIGAGTIERIEAVARTTGVPLLEAAGHAAEQGALGTRPLAQLRKFLDWFGELLARADDESVDGLLETILERTNYEAYLERAYPGQGAERMENARALVSAAAEYADETDDPTLLGFLDRSALVADTDDLAEGEGVTMMTIHCAKGLEFPWVFLVGLEENVFPHSRSSGSQEDLEEERRLCYVAMTRARRRLYLTHARVRRFQGQWMPNDPSRFLSEIPAERVRDVTPAEGVFESTARWPDAPARASSPRTPSGSSAARVTSRPRATHGADATPSAGAAPDDGYAIGTRVRHPKFGVGAIVGREGSGRGLKLAIEFTGDRVRKILPAYTKLLVENPKR